MSVVLAAQAGSLDWVPVSSSNLEAVAYAADFRRLFVRFKGGDRYAYDDVPGSVWEAFLAAPSKGQFLYDEVRGAKGRRNVPAGSLDHLYAVTGPF